MNNPIVEKHSGCTTINAIPGMSEIGFEELFNSIQEGIGIVDENERILYCNPGFVNIFEAESPGQLIGEKFDRYFGEKDQAKINSQTELRKENIASQYELELTSLKGNIKHILLNISPRFDQSGKFIGGFGSILDITARKKGEVEQRRLAEHKAEANDVLEREVEETKRAEETLSQIISEYSAMIDTVPAIMYLKDRDGRYVAINKAFCEYWKKDQNQIIGNCDADFKAPDEAENCDAEDRGLMANNTRIINREEKATDEDGVLHWNSTTKIPLVDSDGTSNGLVGLIQDVTEQHRSREQLIQADKLAGIGTLAAGVAHEINNPIGYINSNLNTMKKYIAKVDQMVKAMQKSEEVDQDDLKDIIEDFEDAIDESIEGTGRVKEIVMDLKTFSRVDRAEKEMANLNDGIKSTLNVVWNELKYKCKVEKDFGEIPEVYCMPNQLNQVFMNLLVNGSQAIAGSDGLIKIKTWADEKYVNITISDNGCGIPENHLKKVFEPFFTTKDVGKGTGLGLSLVFDIIQRHNGEIEVKSEKDVGTEFSIKIPVEGIDE